MSKAVFGQALPIMRPCIKFKTVIYLHLFICCSFECFVFLGYRLMQFRQLEEREHFELDWISSIRGWDMTRSMFPNPLGVGETRLG